MKPFSSNHPMATAWEVIRGGVGFDELAEHPEVLRDTAITVALDESLPARRRSRAVDVLSALEDPLACETCDWALEFSSSSLMRRAAVDDRRKRALLDRRLRYDPSYLVRVSALHALSNKVDVCDLRVAASDPHWRVRYALLRLVEERGEVDSISEWNRTTRENGFVEFALWRLKREQLPNTIDNDQLFAWDPDPAVLLGTLKQQPRHEWLQQLPHLIHHDAEPVRTWATGQLLEFGTPELCALAAMLATDPRHPGWWAVDSLVRRLPTKRCPPWNPFETEDFDFSPQHPAKRECKPIEEETAWMTLVRFANTEGFPVTDLLPATSVQRSTTRSTEKALQLVERPPQNCRIAVSGHYLLPSEGFVFAFEQGVDCFFWEANYGTFNKFMKRLAAKDRQRLRLIGGTFEAEPRKVVKDVERALRLLRVEQLETFLLFWSRSKTRFSDDVMEALERMKSQGKVRNVGLSTHQWELARVQIELGQSPVMVRHNLAHRRAEEIVLPHARARGTQIISFSSTCYGRLIEAGISACDCLRYSLLQPEIGLVLTAPATEQQLRENLSALTMPGPSKEELDKWRTIGDRVYADGKAFLAGLQSR